MFDIVRLILIGQYYNLLAFVTLNAVLTNIVKIMPIVSKYSNERVENISQKLIDLLVDEKVTTDLALMCIGNTLTHIISNQVPEQSRKEIVSNFSKALENSLKSK